MPDDDLIIDLQIRIAHQDKAIAALDDVVREFALRVERLEQELREIRKASESPTAIGPADERPPHY
jgi:uncharacterized coiled-coil protein SlyX